MYTFKTDKKLFRLNLFKNWLLSIVFVGFVLFIAAYIFNQPAENIWMAGLVGLLLKLFDTLNRFVIHEIKIDVSQQKLIIELNSIMSGPKTKEYNLEGIQSIIKQESTYKNIFRTPFRLIIYINRKTAYNIRTNYGFKKETLLAIDNALKSL